ncbi:hypothetical protein [Actinomadura rifamycini]|uniref:hypothetical protein n=1 Tax=Actinomadura rifamycini TaxID=31962 RepID=UPI00054E6EE3|nr:hypothetical protein [Actinomadura rifamycini]
MTAFRTPQARVAAEVARRFPGTSAWLGEATGSWWALARDRAGTCHLVEAATPAELARRLNALDVRRATPSPEPRHPRAAAPVRTVLAPPRPERRHRAPRRGRLRTALGGLVAP